MVVELKCHDQVEETLDDAARPLSRQARPQATRPQAILIRTAVSYQCERRHLHNTLGDGTAASLLHASLAGVLVLSSLASSALNGNNDWSSATEDS